MNQLTCYVNGEFLPLSDAKISVFDHGFTVADGVFETLKFSSGLAFAVDRHLARLQKSCEGLGISCPEFSELTNAILQVSAANHHIDSGRMRITVTSGQGPLGSDRLNVKPTLVVSVAEQKPWAPTSQVLLGPWIRNEHSPLVGLKTTSYAENVFALEKAHSLGFSEAIFLSSQGLLSEGTGSNIFIVRDGQVLTPGTNSGLLEGITRQLVLEWSEYPVIEKDLTEEVFFQADELFLTSSTRDVHPISRIAKLTVTGDVVLQTEVNVGRITKDILKTFQMKSKEQVNP